MGVQRISLGALAILLGTVTLALPSDQSSQVTKVNFIENRGCYWSGSQTNNAIKDNFIPVSFLFIPVSFLANQLITQPSNSKKVEADRLFKEGEQQLNSNQPQAALEYLQQALLIYQQMKERLAEGQTLKSIGNAYYFLKDYPQAIAHQQQVLIIAREMINTTCMEN